MNGALIDIELLVYFHPVELKVGVCERAGVVVDKICAFRVRSLFCSPAHLPDAQRTVAISRASGKAVNGASPVSAERQVDDDVRRREFAVDVALVIREVRGGSAPGVRVDRARAAQYICWDVAGVAWPEPDLDGRGEVPAFQFSFTSCGGGREKQNEEAFSRTIRRRCC